MGVTHLTRPVLALNEACEHRRAETEFASTKLFVHGGLPQTTKLVRLHFVKILKFTVFIILVNIAT